MGHHVNPQGHKTAPHFPRRMGRATMPPVAAKGFKKTLDDLIEGGNPAKITSLRSLGVRLHQLDKRQSAENWRGTLNRYRRADDAPELAIRLIAKALKVSRAKFPPSKERLTLAKLNARLLSIEERAEKSEASIERILRALVDANIALPESPEEPRSDPIDPPHEGEGTGD